jgi:hypothetical protein
MKHMGLIVALAMILGAAGNAFGQVRKESEKDRVKTEAEKEADHKKENLLGRGGAAELSASVKASLKTKLSEVLDMQSADKATRDVYNGRVLENMSDASGKQAVKAIDLLSKDLADKTNGETVSIALSTIINIMSLDPASTVTGEGLANFVAETLLGKTKQSNVLVALTDAKPLSAQEVIGRLAKVQTAMETARKAGKTLTAEDAFVAEFGSKAKGLKGECY